MFVLCVFTCICSTGGDESADEACTKQSPAVSAVAASFSICPRAAVLYRTMHVNWYQTLTIAVHISAAWRHFNHI